MSVDTLLSRLEKVRKTGANSWIARCSAHEDGSPSLSIAEREDRVLLHCFAGCSALAVLESVGLDFSDVMPPRQADSLPPIRRAFPAADVLEALASEAQLVAVAACNVAQGIGLSESDRERLMLASSRIAEGRRMANG